MIPIPLAHPFPWKLVGALVLLAGVFGAGFVRGQKWVQSDWDAEKLAMLKEQQRNVERVHEAAVGHETEKAGLQAEERIITKEVARVVTLYRDRDCLDDSGLQQLRAAVTGTYRGEPAAAVPAASAAR